MIISFHSGVPLFPPEQEVDQSVKPEAFPRFTASLRRKFDAELTLA